MSKRVLLALSAILLFSQNVYSMESESDDEFYSCDSDSGSSSEIDQSEINESEADSLFAPELSEEERVKIITHGRTWSEMMTAFADAPALARAIVPHLKKDKIQGFRAAIFEGAPGTGKSSTALAISHLANWYNLYKSGPALQGGIRNQTKERLQAYLDWVVKQNKKTVVIVDELNQLLEDFESESHDSKATGSYLWSFLDEQRHNKNFFFIGIMNRTNKIPDQIIQRIGGSIINFPPIEHSKLLKIFKDAMKADSQLKLSEECNDGLLSECIHIMEDEEIQVTPREFETLRISVGLMTLAEQPELDVRIATPLHLRNSVQALIKTYGNADYRKENLSDQEWRDFNLVQNRIIDVKLQLSQLAQWAINGTFGASLLGGNSQAGATMSRPPSFDLDQVLKTFQEEFSAYQIALYKRVMKRDHLISPEYIESKKSLVSSFLDKAKATLRTGE